MKTDRPGDAAFTADSIYGTRQEATYAGALSFARRRYTRDLEGVDVAVAGVPLDTATSNRPGARFGPRAVRAASSHISWARQWPWEFDPFDAMAVVDCGDFVFDYGRPQEMPGAIESQARSVLEQGVALLALGGDHFLTYPILRVHAERHGPLSLVHFDAHTDTWRDEDGRVDHGTMFYHATRQGLIRPEQSVQIGIRTTNDDTLGFNVLSAPAVHARGAADVAGEIRSVVGSGPVYLSFDIDCLDPAFAPGTGTPVCGGLTTAQALEIIRRLRGIDVIGMDVVEVAPAYDVGEITALAGATIAYELLCLHAERGKPPAVDDPWPVV